MKVCGNYNIEFLELAGKKVSDLPTSDKKLIEAFERLLSKFSIEFKKYFEKSRIKVNLTHEIKIEE
jgi:hypothetical protein